MLDEIILFVTLGGLAIYIVWEGWQRSRAPVNPLERSHMERGFTPGATQREHIAFVAAAVAAIFGFVLLAEPVHPPFTGRGTVIDSFLYTLFGSWGAPALCWLLALVAFVAALAMRRRRLERRHEG